MQLDATSIAGEVVSSVTAAQKKTGDASIAAAAPGDFCGIWAKAKPILEGIAAIIIFLPGFGTVAAGVLNALIKVGDQVSSQMCPT